MRKSNNVVVKVLTNGMTVNLSMFGFFMKTRIGHNLNSTGVIIMERCCMFLNKAMLGKQSSKSMDFGAIGCSPMLSLNGDLET